MNARKIHKILGLTLLLPFLGWILTGTVFLIKPGYDQAYEKISPKLYPVAQEFSITPYADWLEVRLKKTVLGYHLLVNNGEEWLHLDPSTLAVKPKPTNKEVVLLLEDAVSDNKKRYGNLENSELDGEKNSAQTHYETSTGVELTLDWSTLSIHQKGRDTWLISTLYKIHYLQWFNHQQADLLLGIVGLLSLFVLAYYGLLLHLGSSTRNQR